MPGEVKFVFKGKAIYGSGVVEGELLVSKKPISFLGDVDLQTGIVRHLGKPLRGVILAMPSSRGSTVGPYVLYSLCKRGLGPRAIIAVNPDVMLVIASVIAEVPLFAYAPEEVLNLKNGIWVKIDLDRGIGYAYSNP